MNHNKYFSCCWCKTLSSTKPLSIFGTLKHAVHVAAFYTRRQSGINYIQASIWEPFKLVTSFFSPETKYSLEEFLVCCVVENQGAFIWWVNLMPGYQTLRPKSFRTVPWLTQTAAVQISSADLPQPLAFVVTAVRGNGFAHSVLMLVHKEVNFCSNWSCFLPQHCIFASPPVWTRTVLLLLTFF